MFASAKQFNCDISDWKVHNVTDISRLRPLYRCWSAQVIISIPRRDRTCKLNIDGFTHPFMTGYEVSDAPSATRHAMSRSIIGGVLMLGGGPVIVVCQRQLLTAPDSHSSEVSAAGTILHRLMPMHGLLQELLIPQLRPSPLYTDSQNHLCCQLVGSDETLSVAQQTCSCFARGRRYV